jgi:hypothetical protein
MTRWIRFAVGLLTFLAAHAVEVRQWSAWFGGVHPPWFLNSGRSIAFTLGCVCASSCMMALFGGSAERVRGITFAVGSFVAMTAVLFLQKGGAGSIFPIVMVVGGLGILMGSMFGAFIGAEIRLAVRGRT